MAKYSCADGFFLLDYIAWPLHKNDMLFQSGRPVTYGSQYLFFSFIIVEENQELPQMPFGSHGVCMLQTSFSYFFAIPEGDYEPGCGALALPRSAQILLS